KLLVTTCVPSNILGKRTHPKPFGKKSTGTGLPGWSSIFKARIQGSGLVSTHIHVPSFWPSRSRYIRRRRVGKLARIDGRPSVGTQSIVRSHEYSIWAGQVARGAECRVA